MTKEEAMAQYVQLVGQLVPGWEAGAAGAAEAAAAGAASRKPAGDAAGFTAPQSSFQNAEGCAPATRAPCMQRVI